jgi:hypothetical protein
MPVVAGGKHVSAPHEAWIAADPFKGGFRVLITGPHGFERTVTFAIDDDPAVIRERVTGTTAAPVEGCNGGRKADERRKITHSLPGENMKPGRRKRRAP